MRPYLDAHVHLWTLDDGEHFWLRDKIDGIHRDFTAEDLQTLQDRCGVSGAIVVQAMHNHGESERLLAQVLGVVQRIGGLLRGGRRVDFEGDVVGDDLISEGHRVPVPLDRHANLLRLFLGRLDALLLGGDELPETHLLRGGWEPWLSATHDQDHVRTCEVVSPT